MKNGSLIIFLLALTLAVLLSIVGCSGILIHHAMDQGQTLTVEQIKAFKEIGSDVFGCFVIGGPPPAGSTIWIVVPKGTTVTFKFADQCHLINQ